VPHSLLKRCRPLLVVAVDLDLDLDPELDRVLAPEVVQTDTIAGIDLPERPPVRVPLAYGAPAPEGVP
jgi:hypothetical protein